MKLSIVCFLSILAFVAAQVEEAFVDYETRFLADRVVTLAELKTHATYANGLWTALGGIVYDITNFVHEGGVKHILEAGGIEADTLYMKAYNKGKHPFTMAAVVTQPGIVRIGPLLKDGVITSKPTTRKPTTRKPTTRKPTTRKPTTRKPTTRKPTTRKPTTRKPTTRKPTTMRPTTANPV
jgi:cell division septation protein DedD